MIIGNGLLARSFCEYEKNEEVLIFASGVSNSLEEDEREFSREKQLLADCLSKNSEKILVYFSTCSIYEPIDHHGKYTKHKMDMEDFITNNVDKYIIFRLPQVVGAGGNEHTLLNFLISSIKKGDYFELWGNASRNFIDSSDVVLIARMILDKLQAVGENKVINIASPFSFGLKEIVNVIEGEVGMKGNYKLVNKGCHYDIDLDDMKKYIGDISSIFGHQYLQHLLQKYYLPHE